MERATRLPSVSAVLTQALQEMNKPEADISRLAALLARDQSAMARILRVANSAAMGLREPVKTLECALTMVGEEQFRRLATLAIATEFSGGTSLEPIRYILQRARLCELLGMELGMVPGEMYLFGMLSVVRSTLQIAAEELGDALRMKPELQRALEGEANRYGSLLRLAQAYEQGRWAEIPCAAAAVEIAEERVPATMSAAAQWTELILRVI